MLLFLVFLTPVLFGGIILLRKIVRIERAELLLPAGIVLGLGGFTFFLNVSAFFLAGRAGIAAAYILFIALGLMICKLIKSQSIKINFPKGRHFLFWIAGISLWGLLIYWKTANALTGSDVNLYYSIAHSFVKGNFPFLAPWQPDISLSYHTGASELLGAFYYFSGLNFQFLHLFFSALLIFCASQILIWVIKERHNLTTFILTNLAAAGALVSFGFIYIIWPYFPFKFPQIQSFNQLFFWMRELPTVNQAIEVYGAPVNLDSLIYFIFHAFGISLFFLLITILMQYEKLKNYTILILAGGVLIVLALVNEGLFLAAFPPTLFILGKKIKILLFFFFLVTSIVLFQGGVISGLISQKGPGPSAVIFPRENQIKEDFKTYQDGQERSKLLEPKDFWLPFNWFHPGIKVLLTISLIALIGTKKDYRIHFTVKSLFIAGLVSLFAYHTVVPKHIIANGNRFLAASFLFFSLSIFYWFIYLSGIIKNRVFKISFLIIAASILLSTVLPPLTLLSKNRFGENKLIPRKTEISSGIKWLKEKLPFYERVLVLDKNAPHPSGQVRAMVEAGMFAPVFAGDSRAFTIEASPEYFDAYYYLSPDALQKLKINILLLDNIFLQSLPGLRKEQLGKTEYFEKIFDDSEKENGEQIYKIKEEYLQKGTEIEGIFRNMTALFKSPAKIYIDNEENFNPSYLRRAVIFSLRDKEIYFLPQSGIYLNVEADINQNPPRKDDNYDYLILGANTDPKEKCRCKSGAVWTGLNGSVIVWKVNR